MVHRLILDIKWYHLMHFSTHLSRSCLRDNVLVLHVKLVESHIKYTCRGFIVGKQLRGDTGDILLYNS